MIQIRSEQITALRQDRLNRFVDRMMDHLRARFGTATQAMSATELRQLVRDGIEQARVHGITLERDVRRYLECMAAHGADFGSDPATGWAGEILRRTQLTGTQKMDQIADYETFVLRGKP